MFILVSEASAKANDIHGKISIYNKNKYNIYSCASAKANDIHGKISGEPLLPWNQYKVTA